MANRAQRDAFDRRRLLVAGAVSALWRATERCGWAADLPSQRDWPAVVPSGEFVSGQLPDQWQQLASEVVRDNLPETYVDTRHWGQTKTRWNGVKVRRDGLQLKTHSQSKQVNHGTWKRYQITPLDPAQHLKIKISEVNTAPDGRAAFRLELTAKINAVAQLAEWNRGVRLLSLTVDADAHLQITTDCRLGVKLDATHLPPDLVLQPEVISAEVNVSGFHVNRVSHLAGPLARELSGTLQSLINKRLAEQRPQLAVKLNRQISKHADRLRLSLSTAVQQRWTSFLQPPPAP